MRDRFGHGVSKMELKHRLYPVNYPFGVTELVKFYRTYYSPARHAFRLIDEQGQVSLQHELEQHWAEHNHATDGSMHIVAEYMEMHARRAGSSKAA